MEKSEYQKKYYENNKAKIIEQCKASQKNAKPSPFRRSKIITALNSGEYKRKPLKLMEKFNIIWNTETNTFQ